MDDLFENSQTGLESPATHLFEVTPSDTVDLPSASRALNVTESGVVRVTTIAGDIGTVAVAAGVPFPIRVRRVWATGTTAAGIVSLW